MGGKQGSVLVLMMKSRVRMPLIPLKRINDVGKQRKKVSNKETKKK